MTQQELEKRIEKLKADPLVVVPRNGDLRVYSPSDPTNSYVVRGTSGAYQCNCPDFQYHQFDPGWRCKHILAAMEAIERGQAPSGQTRSVEEEERLAIQEEGGRRESPKVETHLNGDTQMLIKRSISPDGRIDSLSVEFGCPVANMPPEEVRRRALYTLSLQTDIVRCFLHGQMKSNGEPLRQVNPDSPEVEKAIPARMVDIGCMDGRWGLRHFINIEADGKKLKLFGVERQIADFIREAGYPQFAEHVYKGKELNLQCRIITEPSRDGRYLNVARVLPIQSQLPQRRIH